MKVVIGMIAVVTLSGCGVLRDNGQVTLMADAKGMRAFSDALNGLVTNGKASPDADTASWQARRMEMRETTKRQFARSPSLWEKLTTPSPVENGVVQNEK